MAGSLKQLPGWVVSNAESVRRECAPYKAMTLAQRVLVLQDVCKLALDIIRLRPDSAAEALEWRDPLPDSSRRILNRLRAEAQRGERSTAE